MPSNVMSTAILVLRLNSACTCRHMHACMCTHRHTQSQEDSVCKRDATASCLFPLAAKCFRVSLFLHVQGDFVLQMFVYTPLAFKQTTEATGITQKFCNGCCSALIALSLETSLQTILAQRDYSPIPAVLASFLSQQPQYISW